ncbi:amidohydrolase family protein [Thermoproteota archaeon]
MKLIDIHNHLGFSASDEIGQTAEELLGKMDRQDVDISVVFPSDEQERSESYRLPNDKIIEAVRKYPKRLIGLARVNPLEECAADEVKRCLDEGLKGIKLHPTTERFHPAKLRPVLEDVLAAGYAPVVLFHSYHTPGAKPGLWKSIIRDFSRTTFIIGHAGRDDARIAVELTRTFPNAYLEISTNSFNRVNMIIRGTQNFPSAPIDKILYGSDCPYERPSDNVDKVMKACETYEEREMIYFKNAEYILFGKPRDRD